jgi:chaperonin GroEL
VAGGGAAYVSAAHVLDDVPLTDDEAPARDILRRALLSPLRRLARNAGYDPGPVVAKVQASPPGWGFDVVRGECVDMLSANIIDPLPTVRAAFTHGVSAGAMALTTNALVYRSYKDETPSFEP